MAHSSSFFDPLHPKISAEYRMGAGKLSGTVLVFLSVGCFSVAILSLLTSFADFNAQRRFLVLSGGVGGALFGAVAYGRMFFQARRRRADYISGRPERVRRAIAEELGLSYCPARFRAVALSGVGDFSATRRALLAPGDGPGDEDRELELCARIVTDAFEGRSEDALSLCRQLVEVPLLSTRGSQERRLARRDGVVAIARAASGVGDEVDLARLARTPTFEPSLYWACRYGAALFCCLRDDAALAVTLINGAPEWPVESSFQGLHARISQRVGAANVSQRRAA